MAFNYSKYNTQSSGSGDKAPLPEGAYTSNPRTKDKSGSSLKVLKLIAPKPISGGATRHSFLIGSDDAHGTAFLKIDLQDYWLTPEACALAFSKKDKNNPAAFQIDPDDLEQLDPAMLELAQQRITDDAVAKVAAANTPDEAQADATEKAIHNTLLQIQINVGTIFRLQDWAGQERNPQGDLGSLEGTVFEGSVKASNLAGAAPEVSVYSKPVGKSVTGSNATEFKTA